MEIGPRGCGVRVGVDDGGMGSPVVPGVGVGGGGWMLVGGFAFDGGVVVEVVGCEAARSCWSSIRRWFNAVKASNMMCCCWAWRSRTDSVSCCVVVAMASRSAFVG